MTTVVAGAVVAALVEDVAVVTAALDVAVLLRIESGPPVLSPQADNRVKIKISPDRKKLTLARQKRAMG